VTVALVFVLPVLTGLAALAVVGRDVVLVERHGAVT
jgi:hypothetical protein